MPPRRVSKLSPPANHAKKKAELQQGSEHPCGDRPLELIPHAKRPRGKKEAEQQQEDDYLSSMADAYLSEHILQQIFIRMPTKPLVQLKCLSKHWNRQILDPNFMKLRSRRMIFLPSIPFHAIDNTGAPSMATLISPEIIRKECTDMIIAGSFNGILLLVLRYLNSVEDQVWFDDDKILYNPFTGQFRKVPHLRTYDAYTKYVYGFGYGDDLKIVKLGENSDDDSKSCEVFSFKTWSWSRPSMLYGDYFISNSYSGIFVNGFLYWNAVRTTQSHTPLILALDMKTMVFSEIEIADGRDFKRLGTYNGRLCMLCSQINMEGYELRVMNEHGSVRSWFTVLSFKPSFPMRISYAALVGTLCILDDGKLLMRDWTKQHLVIYDTLKDSYMDVKALQGFAQKGLLQSLEYVESPISPWDICAVSI